MGGAERRRPPGRMDTRQWRPRRARHCRLGSSHWVTPRQVIQCGGCVEGSPAVMSDQSAPPGIDTTKPSIARVYDYMLGGKDNFAIDRHVAEIGLKITPDGPAAARANRAFLRRVVRHLVADVGIRQFIDVGSGLPTQGNVHEIAAQSAPDVRVIYIDR